MLEYTKKQQFRIETTAFEGNLPDFESNYYYKKL